MLTRLRDGIARRVQATPPPIRVVEVPVPVQVAAHGFDHVEAQKYELEHNRQTIAENFARVYADYEAAMTDGRLWQGPHDQWFQSDVDLFNSFAEHVRERKCLEVGSGPFGHIAPCYWMKDRVIIEPLVEQYREAQLAINGKTFFPDEIKRYDCGAENIIPELVGKVDGFIVSRNALDHCEDALTILLNLSDYAAPGCWFLLWTDIWHLQGLDAGHHNITKSFRAMDVYLDGLGFDIIKRGANLRDPAEYLEYGVIAVKRPRA